MGYGMMGDIIVNGYITMWQLALIFSWIPIGFLGLELKHGFKRPTSRKRKILKMYGWNGGDS